MKFQNILSKYIRKSIPSDNELLMNFVSVILEKNILPNIITTYDQNSPIDYVFLIITKGVSEVIF